jgi:hypothetical protein
MEMSDNDARIASLVENIPRKGLDDEEKRRQIEEIYKDGGYKDIEQVKSYLSKMHNLNSKKIKIKDNPKRAGMAEKIFVPTDFIALAKRVAYSPSYQYRILARTLALKPFSEQNHLENLYRHKREIIESKPQLEVTRNLRKRLCADTQTTCR